MLAERLIALSFPIREEVALPSTKMEALTSWLFDGYAKRRVVVADVDPGHALATLISACRALDPDGTCQVSSGALDGIENGLVEAVPKDLEATPEGWSQGLSDGRLLFSGTWEDLTFTLRARLSTRHDPRVPSMSLILRALYSPILPEPDEADLTAYCRELQRTFEVPDSFGTLEALLRDQLDRLSECLCEHLGEGPLPGKTRILTLKKESETEDMLHGFSEDVLRCLFFLGAIYEARGGEVSDKGIWRLGEGGRLWLFRGVAGDVEVMHGT